MRMVTLTSDEQIPALVQGTWRMGEDASIRQQEIEALRTGVELGLRLIDTAEMYGDGAAETLLGEALGAVRDDVFLCSKAYPQNATQGRLIRSCEASLARLGTDRLDLYLLHWRGRVPLAETVEGMEALRSAGKIRHWGVSNLDQEDMEELAAASGLACVTDQILYNLTRRGPERALMPWLARNGISVMAYSPVEQGRLTRNDVLSTIATELGLTAAQVALAWTLRRPDVIAIPKAARASHVRENFEAAAVVLDTDVLDRLDTAFPAPGASVPLEML